MTAPRPVSGRRVVLVIVGVAVVLAIGLGGGWYLFFRPAGPAPVSLGTSAPATPVPTAAPSAVASASVSTLASDEPSARPDVSAVPGEGIEGSWTTDPSIGSFSDFSSSFAGYRVKETLANVGATEAVGRTPDVTGSMTFEGTTILDASFEADLTTLQSDERFRDGQLRRQALETDTFPTATFKLSAPLDLGHVPAEGETVSVTATGDLTLHGVTKSVEVPLQARLEGNVITITGSLPITFKDFGIAKPQSMMVLSVEDQGVMEVQLKLGKGLG